MRLSLTLALCAGIFLAGRSEAALVAFLKLEGPNGTIQGEATHALHKDEIAILAWSWGTERTLAPANSPEGGSLKDQGVLSLVKRVDRISAELLLALLQAHQLHEGTLVVRRVGGDDSIPVLTIKLERIQVVSYSAAAATGEDTVSGALSLPAGVSWLGFSQVSANADAFGLLRSVGEAVSISALDSSTGRIVTAAVDEHGLPVGINFPLRRGAGYVLSLRAAAASVPNL